MQDVEILHSASTLLGQVQQCFHHGDSKLGVLDAKLTSHNDGSKGQRPAHVDGAVVEGHGSGLALGKQLGNETEADWVLSGLCSCETHPGGQQLTKAIHLHHMPQPSTLAAE